MLLAVIVILGAGRFFETTYPLETYFDESVNGLAVGSPVKLRGVAGGTGGGNQLRVQRIPPSAFQTT